MKRELYLGSNEAIYLANGWLSVNREQIGLTLQVPTVIHGDYENLVYDHSGYIL